MTDVPFLRQIAAEFKGFGQEGNSFAKGYRIMAQCVADACDEIERLREIEAWANEHPTRRPREINILKTKSWQHAGFPNQTACALIFK